MTREEIVTEIHRIKTEGINSDQENKSMMEEYVDAIAEKRIIEELEQQLKEIDNPVQSNYMQTVPDSQWYINLEGILQGLKSVKARIHENQLKEGLYGYTCYINSVEDELQEMITGINNSILKGMYIKQDGKE